MFIVIDEDGFPTKIEALTDDILLAVESGALDVISLENPKEPKILLNAEDDHWEVLENFKY
jgi:hypothetical protein